MEKFNSSVFTGQKNLIPLISRNYPFTLCILAICSGRHRKFQLNTCFIRKTPSLPNIQDGHRSISEITPAFDIAIENGQGYGLYMERL